MEPYFTVSTLVFCGTETACRQENVFSACPKGFFRSERMIFSGSDRIAKIMLKKTKVETLYILMKYITETPAFQLLPDTRKKPGFSENFMPQNLWNLTYILS